MTLAADRMDIIVPSALLSHASDSRIPDWHKNILYRSVCCSMASSQTLFHSSVAVHNRWGLLLHVYFQVAETKFRHVIQLLFSYKLFCVVFDDPSDIRRILQYRARSQAPHFFNLTLSTSAMPQDAQHTSPSSVSVLFIVSNNMISSATK